MVAPAKDHANSFSRFVCARSSALAATATRLSETALEKVEIAPDVLQSLQGQMTERTQIEKTNWRDLWPERPSEIGRAHV